MDLPNITNIGLFVLSGLLSVNAFFVRGLIKKIETSDKLGAINNTKLEMVIQRIDIYGKDFVKLNAHLATMERDVAVLRYAIRKKWGSAEVSESDESELT